MVTSAFEYPPEVADQYRSRYLAQIEQKQFGQLLWSELEERFTPELGTCNKYGI